MYLIRFTTLAAEIISLPSVGYTLTTKQVLTTSVSSSSY